MQVRRALLVLQRSLIRDVHEDTKLLLQPAPTRGEVTLPGGREFLVLPQAQSLQIRNGHSVHGELLGSLRLSDVAAQVEAVIKLFDLRGSTDPG